MRRSSLFLAFLISCLLFWSCGDDTTAPPQSTVSLRSYVEEVYGARYISVATLPSPTTGAALAVVTADTVLGRGSVFSLTLRHPAGLRMLLIGAKDAVGYFELPIDATATETRVRGRLSVSNRSDFEFVCTGMGMDGAVLSPVNWPMDVLSGESVHYYIAKVLGADGREAEYIDDLLPLPTKGTTITSVESDSIAVNGGSLGVTLHCIVPAGAIRIGVPNSLGHFRLPTAGLPGEVSMVIVFAQSVQSSFVIQFLSEEPGPQFGAIASVKPTLIHVGSGDLQVSLAFRPSQDLDLHLVEPTGEEIYYGNPTSAAGGRLDLDSNAACRLDHKNNENITYEGRTPPRGEYVVRVDFWQSCDGTGAMYRVVVAVLGEVRMYSSSFEPEEADRGGLGSGREVCRFTY